MHLFASNQLHLNILKLQVNFEWVCYFFEPFISLNSHGKLPMTNCVGVTSAPPSKNAVSAFQISCKILSFDLEDSWRNFIQTIFFYLENVLKKLAGDQCSSITKGSIYHIKHTTFYHNSGLTRNMTFNGSICYVLYLQILRFYFVGQIPRGWKCQIWLHNENWASHSNYLCLFFSPFTCSQ